MMKQNVQQIVNEAQAMQKRFAEQTTNQILVCNRLTAQRDALLDCCERMLNALSGFYEEHDELMQGWRQDVAEAKTLDPEG